MTQYKVEALTFYSKMTLDLEHIATTSAGEIQELLNTYARDGWRLVSTNATSHGFAVYVYLYFEREVAG